ncbi:AAA family ATPase [Cytophagaceae bacterium DM2B3-1]|uniref:AAA family ATPase n=1 Tax=Xanthocytophaga flava TaxID=3048013 RepID=A0ABT7CYM8_9BACT|nr:AAA family ATPase [Xanthocytophaga flavus]MDJ1498884.1 AAA family ATPase [Xanthocytophaga flavus]
MRIDFVHIRSRFKNLEDFRIDLNENYMETVLLGQNATGKSNFIEALVLIFKHLDLDKPAPFAYTIQYVCREKLIEISTDEKGKYKYSVDSTPIKTQTEFRRRKQELLPKYVFTYYSGISNRLKDHFDEHQLKFYDKIIKPNTRKEEVDDLRKLFYVQLIHSYFVLMAYFSFEADEKDSIAFLNEVLHIEDLESILFVLKQPQWSRGKKEAKTDRFWTAAGLVREFLDKLWGLTLAPIYNDEPVKIDFRTSEIQEKLYLYISTKQKLRQLAGYYNDNTDFFKALESTYISDLIDEVRVKVKKRNVDGEVTFKELSEGEQQLLTVLGLLRFTKDEESLILLDEPDTHLNPLWKWKYLEYLRTVVKRPETTQIIINTHDPLLIGSLVKEQVRMFKRQKDTGKVYAIEPDVDPKGLGVAGILTSDLFDLPTILDKETQENLNRKRYLQGKLMREGLTDSEKEEFNILKDNLARYGGYYDVTNDAWYNRYLEEISKNALFQKVEFSEEEKEILERESREILEQMLKEKTDTAL